MYLLKINDKESGIEILSNLIKKDSKLEALNMIVSKCDLTTLEGEDTEGKISQMVAKAIKPNPLDNSVPSVAAVCVYPSLVGIAKEKVQNSNVKVAAVSSYFPSGQVPMESKLLDTKYAIDSGAEIVFGGKFDETHGSPLYFEPTVITNLNKSNLLNIDETFGPVAPILSFENDHDLFDIVKASPFGLFGSIFTKDLSKAIS